MKLDRVGQIKGSLEGNGDNAMQHIVFAVSLTGILLMVFLLFFLFVNGLPVLRDIPIRQIIFGFDWYPTEEPPALGMLPLIVATLAVTLLSSIIALPIAIALAVFTAEIAPRKTREFFKVLLELLGFIPSIVLGFIGMMILAPSMQDAFGIASGLNLLTSSIILGFLIIPTVASLSEEALSSVSHELREASFALGATRWETIRKVVLPFALPGVSAAVLLGVMRALGETMVVLMVSGGAAIVPHSLTDPVRPLTSTIAAEMGETPVGSIHYHALFFAGLILLIMTLVINLTSYWIERRRVN
jgi:phosphate transport system permease protein